MSQRLNVTDPSLFPPLEVEVEGQVYLVKKLTRPMWNAITRLLERQKAGDMNAFYEQVPLVTEIPVEVADSLGFQEVQLIVKFITDKLFTPLAGLTDAEKKVSEPGEQPQVQ